MLVRTCAIAPAVVLILASHTFVRAEGAEDWPRFRGPTAMGVVEDDPRLPDRWSKTENVRWATETPGWGWSSPIICGGKVFLTTPDIVYDHIDMKTHSIDFSIPLEMMGEPEADWKYFVGVGLTTNRLMNYIHGGPTFVRQNHRAFISGGNYPQGNPDFIDILLEPSIDQEKLLSQYDVPNNMMPTVKMVGISE